MENVAIKGMFIKIKEKYLAAIVKKLLYMTLNSGKVYFCFWHCQYKWNLRF